MTLSDVVVANIIAFLALGATVFSIIAKAKERTQTRHEENLLALNKIWLEITKLAHLDPCVDEMKEEILKLRERVHDLIDEISLLKLKVAEVIREE